MKIYTKGGDAGETSMFSGERVSKADPHIAAVGDLDELSVAIGFARLANPGRDAELKAIQQELYRLSAAISYVDGKASGQYMPDPAWTDRLEDLIDTIDAKLPPLTEFIFPGRSDASCRLHQARVVARRTERTLVLLPEETGRTVIPYVNRLSDLFFMLAREADHALGVEESKLKDGG